MDTDDRRSHSCFGLTDWQWLNPPRRWTPSEDRVEVTTDADTDFWVTTHYGFVRDTGHALLHPVPSTFVLRATFDGDYRERYDQAGLLLRLDHENWIRAGIEYVDGRQQLSAVVTRDVSDWNMIPLDRITDSTGPVTVEISRTGDHVTICYLAGDDPSSTLLRLAWFPPDVPARAGIMCASPEGRGFATRFTDVRLETGS